MKHTLLASVAAVGLMAAPAFAGVNLENLGRPTCIERNPATFEARGLVASNVHGDYESSDKQIIAYDPYPWKNFTSSPYSFVEGWGVPGSMGFSYSTPQTELDMVWGFVAPGQVVELLDGNKGTLRISGSELINRGIVLSGQTVYVRISFPDGRSWRRIKLHTGLESPFEFNVGGCSN
jgi:hypothetical protein